MAFTVSSTVLLAIRAVQALFALIVLGTAAYVATWWPGAWHVYAPAEYSFLIFTAVWTLLALVYLIVVPMRFSNSVVHHKFAIIAVEALTTLFWFAGFIAAAVFMTGRIGWGTINNNAIAAIVFAAFNWLLFAATTTLAVLHLVHSRGHVSETKGTAAHPVVVQEGV